jgi:hypothetical protein
LSLLAGHWLLVTSELFLAAFLRFGQKQVARGLKPKIMRINLNKLNCCLVIYGRDMTLAFINNIFFKIRYDGFDARESIDSGDMNYRITLVNER